MVNSSTLSSLIKLSQNIRLYITMKSVCRDSILDMLYCDIDECYSPDNHMRDVMMEKVSK
jgi:hypothetical protein